MRRLFPHQPLSLGEANYIEVENLKISCSLILRGYYLHHLALQQFMCLYNTYNVQLMARLLQTCIDFQTLPATNHS